MHTGVSTARVSLVRRHGIRRGGVRVSVRFLPHEKDYCYTPVISKRQGNAVERNRVRRSIRGIMQRKGLLYPRGWYIIYFNDSCSAYDLAAVEAELDSIAGSIARYNHPCDHGKSTQDDTPLQRVTS